MSLDALYLNTAVCLACALAWRLWGSRQLSSPLFLYLIFHLLSFVVRPWFIALRDDQSYLRWWIGIWPFPEHHQETMLLASLGLVMMTAGGLLGERLARARGAPRTVSTLDPSVVKVVGLAMVVLGVLSYTRFAAAPWIEPGYGPNTSQFIRTTQGYTTVSTTTTYITGFYLVIVGVFIVWICQFGMRWYYVPFLTAFMLGIIYTATSRTTYLVGGIALVLAVMARQGRRWPSLRALLVLLVLLLSFLGGKGWLQTLRFEGREAARAEISRGVDDALAGRADIFLNYDMLVAVDYLVPHYADHTNIRLYLRPLYFWIPRQLWPGKPVFDFAAAYIYARVPQISFQGLVVTLVGESYLAFGIPSVIVLLFCYGVLFNFIQTRGSLAPAWSVERIFTIALVASLFQVYRDGIVSLPQYMLYYFGPCLVMWLVSQLFGRARRLVLAPDASSRSPIQVRAGAAARGQTSHGAFATSDG